MRILKLLLLLWLLISISSALVHCKKDGGENQFGGVILLDENPQPDVYIKNTNKRISTVSDRKGIFSIKAERGDLILFEKDEYSTAVVVEEINTKAKVVLKKLQRKTFYFRNYEPFLFHGDIFVVIPETRYLSPMLSNGMIIFYFPEEISQAFVITATSYANLNLGDIQEYEVIDLRDLSFTNLPEKVTVSNITGDKIILEDILHKLKIEIYPGSSTFVTTGIYNVINDSKIIDNLVILKDIAIQKFELYPRQEIFTEVKGKATTLFNEKDVLIWAEGSGLIWKSDPSFSIKIPYYSKRIFFSKAFRFPEVVKIDDNFSGNVNIELNDISYASGYIYPASQTYYVNVENPKDENLLLSYVFHSTNFSIVLPYGKNMAISVTSPSLIPKLIDLYTGGHFIDLGTIFLCSAEDENCIIEEGKAFLKFGIYQKAREVFKLARSDIGKIGLFLADFGLLMSELYFPLSEKGKLKFYNEWIKIYDETVEVADELTSKETQHKFCSDRIHIFGIFSQASVGGCTGIDSVKFMISILRIIKAINLYFYGHKLIDEDVDIGKILFPEPEYIGKLGMNLASSAEVFRREKYFDPSTSISLLIKGLKDLADSFRNLESCKSVDELICVHGDLVSIKSGSDYTPLMNSKFEFQKVIDSLNGTYDLGISDIISILPLQNSNIDLPDFLRINLYNFLKNNDLRSLFPSVIFRDGVPFLAVEVEVPTGFMGIKDQDKFIEPIFSIGDSPHFQYGLEPLLYKDGIFPSATTDYFQDYKSQEFIVYFYFDDPTFGKSLKLYPCSLTAIASQEITERWCRGEDTYQFRFPTNQMLNDVAAVVQKYLKLQFIIVFMSIRTPLSIF